MTFQASVRSAQALGVIGEILLDGPNRTQPGIVEAGDATAADIVVGRAFTQDPTSLKFQPGSGGGVWGGILCNPKAYASVGTQAGGPLAPTLVLPAETVGEFCTMGYLVASMANGFDVGDKVMYADATGILSSLPPIVTFTGVIAVTTGILTVSAASAGANLGVGTIITGTGVPGGTVITALGSGTGGDGTYQTNIVTAVSSFADGAAVNVAPAGSTEIENARVVRYANASAGLAVISLTGA